MNTSFESQTNGSEAKDELLVHHDEPTDEGDRSTVGSSVRDMAARIPEQLSAIGRDISRTIERAIAAKDDYMLAVKVSQDAQGKLGQLVQAGGIWHPGRRGSFFCYWGNKIRTGVVAHPCGKPTGAAK